MPLIIFNITIFYVRHQTMNLRYNYTYNNNNNRIGVKGSLLRDRKKFTLCTLLKSSCEQY